MSKKLIQLVPEMNKQELLVADNALFLVRLSRRTQNLAREGFNTPEPGNSSRQSEGGWCARQDSNLWPAA